jgi:hypothetical protein
MTSFHSSLPACMCVWGSAIFCCEDKWEVYCAGVAQNAMK